MLTALEYSAKYNFFNENEEYYVKNAVKAHVLGNAHKIENFFGPFRDKESLTNETKTR